MHDGDVGYSVYIETRDEKEIKMSKLDLMTYCNGCSDRQNANYREFPKDWAARNQANEAIKEDFKEKVSAHFGYADAPQAVKDKVFSMAWEAGHSAGYYEVADNMGELFELVALVQASTVEA